MEPAPQQTSRNYKWGLILMLFLSPGLYFVRLDGFLEPEPAYLNLLQRGQKRPAPSAYVTVSSLHSEQPLSVTPLWVMAGQTVTVTCRAEGPLQGAQNLSLRWMLKNGREGTISLQETAPGVFLASLPTDPSASLVKLICFDPQKSLWRPGFYAPLYLFSQGSRERFPHFLRSNPRPAVKTIVVNAMSGNSMGPSQLNAPMEEPLNFDRKTESPSLDYYWISQEGLKIKSEEIVAELDDVASTLKNYLRPLDSESKSVIYFKKRDVDGDIERHRKTVQGTADRQAIRIFASEAALIPVAVHELTHYYTQNVFINEKTAFIEGLAVFMEHSYANTLGDLHMRASRVSPVRCGLHAISSQQFYGIEGLWDRYLQSGSFVAFLVERHGIDPVLRAIAGTPLRRAFRKSEEDLCDEWTTFLHGL